MILWEGLAHVLYLCHVPVNAEGTDRLETASSVIISCVVGTGGDAEQGVRPWGEQSRTSDVFPSQRMSAGLGQGSEEVTGQVRGLLGQSPPRAPRGIPPTC